MALDAPRFEQFIQKTLSEWKVLGLSIAVVQGDAIYTKEYGFAALPQHKVDTDTLFDCASVSKISTAAAVALLVDDDKYPDVQWKTPVSKILPDDFVLQDPYLMKEITVEDILSHRTGFPYYDDSYFSVRAAQPDNAKSMTRNLRNLEFSKPLRTAYLYCNIMFTVATHLVETVSGEKYLDFIRKRLWEPLNMTNTFHDIPDIEAHNAMNRKATGYRWDLKKDVYIDMPVYPQPEGQGAGCIFTSSGDYAKWIRAMLKRSMPLSEAAHDQLTTPRTIISKGDYEIPFTSQPLYALGLCTESYRGYQLLSHSGSVPGFKAAIALVPQFNWGLVMMSNSEDAEWAHQIIWYTLMDEVLGVPKEERVDWPAFYRTKYEEYEADEKKVDPELAKPDNPEPLGIPLEQMVGTYRNAGYKNLVLEMKGENLVADCNDRCMPFELVFNHLNSSKLVVDFHDFWTDMTKKMKGEVRIEDGKVVSLGVDFEEDLDDLIWFDAVQ
ncbi:beta-lactamase/transpeptidase-like protein [Phaeosphaeriaceae sp. PMI808]|nr:beta-lactamase/transpeptidase-like protein [Phaeosphaeriaceae sp. PMI808]